MGTGRSQDLSQQVGQRFLTALNQHGYPFHQTVLKIAEDARVKRRSYWRVKASEFPVEVRGYGTRIDVILEHDNPWVLLLAECKRANPALSNWCFSRASWTPCGASTKQLFIEGIVQTQTGAYYTEIYRAARADVYHIALEVRTDATGDTRGSGRGAIEDAASQICRGSNGFAEFLKAEPSFLCDVSSARNVDEIRGIARTLFLFPVIFTTARLWVSDEDLGTLNLSDNHYELADLAVREVPWVVYHYHQSPGLKHSIRSRQETSELGEYLYDVFVRTIFIVNAQKVEDFLGSDILDIG